SIPTGRMEVRATHDPLPGFPHGVPIKVELVANNAERIIDIDLRDNIDCLPCGLNLTEGTARTAAMVGVFNSLPFAVPTNAGSFRRVRVHLRKGCAVGVPVHPASCSVATTNLADRVANAVQRGISSLADGVGMAEAGLMQPPAWAVISGKDP